MTFVILHHRSFVSYFFHCTMIVPRVRARSKVCCTAFQYITGTGTGPKRRTTSEVKCLCATAFSTCTLVHTPRTSQRQARQTRASAWSAPMGRGATGNERRATPAGAMKSPHTAPPGEARNCRRKCRSQNSTGGARDAARAGSAGSGLPWTLLPLPSCCGDACYSQTSSMEEHALLLTVSSLDRRCRFAARSTKVFASYPLRSDGDGDCGIGSCRSASLYELDRGFLKQAQLWPLSNPHCSMNAWTVSAPRNLNGSNFGSLSLCFPLRLRRATSSSAKALRSP